MVMFGGFCYIVGGATNLYVTRPWSCTPSSEYFDWPLGLSAFTLYRDPVYVSSVFNKQSFSDAITCTEEIVGKRIVLCGLVSLQFDLVFSKVFS
jgi:hypothetical protein